MKQELTDKIAELKDIVDEDGDLMVIAEKYLNDYNLEQFALELRIVVDHLDRAKKLFEANAEEMTEENIDDLGALAQALDESGDSILMKQASVLDEILMTIGANPKARGAFKKAEQEEIDRLRAKYNDTNKDYYTKAREEHKKEINVNEAIKAIDNKVKKYRPLEASLSTRYSPDMPGVNLMRIGEHVYQCPVTKKIYDFKSGYTTAKGNIVPGSDVSNQTQHLGFRAQEHMNFSSREDALNRG